MNFTVANAGGAMNDRASDLVGARTKTIIKFDGFDAASIVGEQSSRGVSLQANEGDLL
jgi:hypothetical protein